MKHKYVYPILVLLLIAYLLFASWQLYTMQQEPTLPLSQKEAEQIGGKLLWNSYPDLFFQWSEGHRLEMEIMAVDEGDTWDVFIYHEPHLIETRDGRTILPYYASNFVVLDKATGNVVRFGFCD